MRLLQSYKSLNGYLERFTLLECGGFHSRIHRILSPDRTPFLHNHPFHFVSVILWGGYLEKTELGLVNHSVGSIIYRSPNEFHRIMEVKPNTVTLFTTWGTGEWSLKPDDQIPIDWVNHEPGIYIRNLYGRDRYCKFDVFWHRAHDSPQAAEVETKPSIDQTSGGNLIRLLTPRTSSVQ